MFDKIGIIIEGKLVVIDILVVDLVFLEVELLILVVFVE